MSIFCACAASNAEVALNNSESSPVKPVASCSYLSHSSLSTLASLILPSTSIAALATQSTPLLFMKVCSSCVQLYCEQKLCERRDCPIFHDTDSERRGGQ